MHETTVVGWDGSSTAETALEWAIARAELQPDGMRRLILVRAVDETLLEDEAQVLATAGADVAERARRMGEEHPLLDVEAIAVRGEPGDVLADRSGDEVLVVVGAENAHTEEYSHSSRLGPRLAGAADGPVAVVPIGDSLARSGVMVAVDHDAPSERLCRLAADYAADRGATLHAMHVGTRAHDVAEDAEILNRALAPALAEHRDLAVVTHVGSGPTARALLKRGRERATVFVGSRRLGRYGGCSSVRSATAWSPTRGARPSWCHPWAVRTLTPTYRKREMRAQLHLLGAADTVTGSRYLIETESSRAGSRTLDRVGSAQPSRSERGCTTGLVGPSTPQQGARRPSGVGVGSDHERG